MIQVDSNDKNLIDKLRKRSKRRNNLKRDLGGILLTIWPLIGFTLFGLIPLTLSIIMSFFKIRGYSLEGAEFVGMANFVKVVQDEQFWKSLRNTFIMACSLPITLILAFILAFFLNMGLKGAKVFRAIYFIPYVCSVVAVSLMWQWLFNTNYGVINQWLGRTGENAIDWLGDEKTFFIVVLILNTWGGTAYGIILYGAALTNVNKSLIDAAKVDGANAFQRFWHIVFPAVSPTTFYLFTMGLIGALQAFAVTNILASGSNGPNDAGLTAVYYIYRNIFSNVNQVGVAAAASWILSLIIFVVILTNFLLSKLWTKYD